MASLVEILDHHREATGEIMSLYRQQAMLRQQELQGRQRAWESSTETTVKGRELSSDFSVINFSLELLKIEGEIRAVQARLRHLELMIDVAREQHG